MQTLIIDKIYKAVTDFCSKRGLLVLLKESLIVSENERFSSLEINSAGLGVLDAVHCIVDKKRSLMLMEEIYREIKDGDTVLEAGLGTGILSYVASQKANMVYGCEINHEIYNLACEIRIALSTQGLVKNNIFFKEGDARILDPDNKVDVIISENLYTGMFFEKQVEIVDSLKKTLAPNGKIIPSGIKSSVLLCESDLFLKNSKKQMYVVSELKSPPDILSSEIPYDNLDFQRNDSSGVHVEKEILIKNDGFLNSVLIRSDVLLPSGNVITNSDTIFMNNDILIVLEDTIPVQTGDKVKVLISYLYGSNPNDSNITIKRV